MTRVLVVEDSPTQAELLRADLTGAGFGVVVARSGLEALGLLESEQVDLVVSDVVMPGMDGYKLCREVKDNPDTQEVPVVLLTSLTDPLDVVMALESGADNLIRKPYQPDQLLARLRTLLRAREARRDDAADTDVQLSLRDRDFRITAERQQILDLLVSTFEELVVSSREIRAREGELSQAHAALERHLHRVDLERNRLQALVDAVPVPLFVVGEHGRITHSSQSLADMFASSPARLRELSIDEVAQFVDVDGRPIDTDALPHRRALREGRPASMGWAFDVSLLRPDGARPPVMFQASPVLDDQGSVAGCVGTLQVLGDIARHDSLTGLPNRLAFLDRAASIRPSQRPRCAVMLIELDRFEAVRAALGTAGSNDLLADVSRRLRQMFQPSSGSEVPGEHMLAHLGGDQFGVILANLPDVMAALRLAESARLVMADWSGQDRSLRLTGSVGVSVGAAELDVPQLLAAARAAVSRAREAGGNRVEFFGPDASQEAMDRLRLEVDLRAAVDHGQIAVEYQPVVSLATGGLLGFEALARWRHPERGPVPPDVFIGLAEESGLVLELGRQVLERACAEACRWQSQQGGRGLAVSVNVSAVQLRPALVEEVMEVLARTGLEPSLLVLEVTETAAMGDPGLTGPVLDELRRHGIRFALDDFGTGYSSMVHLTRMNFDQLKLDRSFVAGMGGGGADTIVVKSIVALGRSLGVPVLAEGIEDEAQREQLRVLGCEQAQGYLFSRPLTGEAAARFIEAAGRGAAG